MAHPRINERDYSVESEYEYGSRAGFWRMFRLFSKHGLKFTLYAAGHDVASHAYCWINYHDYPVDREREYIKKAVLSLKAPTGYAPRGWYYSRPSPHSRSLVPVVYEELGEELVRASDAYADDVPYWTDLPMERDCLKLKRCLMVPYSYDCNDFKFLSAGPGFRDTEGFYNHLKNAFDMLYEEGQEGAPKMMTIGLPCRITGRPGRFAALRDFVEYIGKKEGVGWQHVPRLLRPSRSSIHTRKGDWHDTTCVCTRNSNEFNTG
ncbi:hypothetical protein RB601_002067 [Gaeumannomyces tritici]